MTRTSETTNPFESQNELTADAEPPSFLVFAVGGHEYAIEIETTEGVVDCPLVCPLPSPPDGVVGVASVRGRMTIVMDLSEGGAEPAKRRLVLLKGDQRLGLLADRVQGVTAMEDSGLKPLRDRNPFRWPAKGYFDARDHKLPLLDVEHLVE